MIGKIDRRGSSLGFSPLYHGLRFVDKRLIKQRSIIHYVVRYNKVRQYFRVKYSLMLIAIMCDIVYAQYYQNNRQDVWLSQHKRESSQSSAGFSTLLQMRSMLSLFYSGKTPYQLNNFVRIIDASTIAHFFNQFSRAFAS